MMLVPPQSSFHCVDVSEDGDVKDIIAVSQLPIWENGGYFVLVAGRVRYCSRELRSSSRTSAATLAGQGKLFGYKYDGFWKPADTFKERAELDAGYNSGDRPWMVWEHAAKAVTIGAVMIIAHRRYSTKSPSSERIATISLSAWAARC